MHPAVGDPILNMVKVPVLGNDFLMVIGNLLNAKYIICHIALSMYWVE